MGATIILMMSCTFKEFESLFCKTVVPVGSASSGSKGSGGGGRRSGGSSSSRAKKVAATSFIDMRRANNVSIGLGRFQKLVSSLEGLRVALYVLCALLCSGVVYCFIF